MTDTRMDLRAAEALGLIPVVSAPCPRHPRPLRDCGWCGTRRRTLRAWLQAVRDNNITVPEPGSCPPALQAVTEPAQGLRKPRGVLADPEGYDEQTVRLACDGGIAVELLSWQERAAAIRALAGRGMCDRDIALRLQWRNRTGGPGSDAVLRWRSRYNIPSGYLLNPTAPRARIQFDQANVDAALAGRLRAGELTTPERRAAVRALVGLQFTDREIAERLQWRPDPRAGIHAVQVFRNNHGIPAGRTIGVGRPARTANRAAA